MKIGRRGFLKLAGGLVAATVAAPIAAQTTSAGVYIPAERLDMGVPRALKPAAPTLREYRSALADKIAPYDAALAMYRENLVTRGEFERVSLPAEPGLPSFRDHIDTSFEREIMQHGKHVYVVKESGLHDLDNLAPHLIEDEPPLTTEAFRALAYGDPSPEIYEAKQLLKKWLATPDGRAYMGRQVYEFYWEEQKRTHGRTPPTPPTDDGYYLRIYDATTPNIARPHGLT